MTFSEDNTSSKAQLSPESANLLTCGAEIQPTVATWKCFFICLVYHLLMELYMPFHYRGTNPQFLELYGSSNPFLIGSHPQTYE